MPQNPLDALSATPSQSGAAAEPVAAAAPSSNPLDALGASPSPAASPAPAAAPQSANPLDSLGAGSSASAPRPESGQPADADAPWYKKLWDFGNAPLVDSDQIARWTGVDENSNGFVKGFTKLAQGLTSPISIALTIGSLPFGGEAGLIESGGVAALKTAGMGAAEVADVVKGSQILAKAVKNGKTAEEGMAAVGEAGVDTGLFQKGLNTLADSGLKPDSIAAHGIVRNVGGAALRQAGVTAATADKVSHGIQILMEGGFTAQNAYTAAVTSPRVLDALKEGDYQKAAELGTEALGTGLFGYLGVRGLHADAGALMSDVAAKAGIHVVPSVENLQLRNNFGIRDADQLQAGRTHQLWEEGLRKQYPDLTPDSLHRVMKYVQSGMDGSVMAKRYAALAEAGGRPVAPEEYRNPLDAALRPENGQPFEAGAPGPSTPSTPGYTYHGTNLERAHSIAEEGLNTHNPGDFTDQEEWPDGSVEPRNYFSDKASSTAHFLPEEGKPALLRVKKDGRFKTESTGDVYSTGVVPPEHLEILHKDGQWVPLEEALASKKPPVAPETTPAEPITSGMSDERVKELIGEKHVATKYAPKDLDKLLDSYDHTKLTDSEKAIAPAIRDKFSETLERAQKDGTLGEGQGVQDYVTQMWDKEANNPAANVLNHQANMGNFAVNTAMARKRIFDNAFEGELLGKKLAVTDPIALAAHNANIFDRINANRQALTRLLDNNTRADDGMPLVAMKGTGQVVTDADGLNPAVLVNPNSVRRIQIADKVVQGLKDSGDLDKMLADGRIKKIGTDDAGKDTYAYNPANYKSIDSPAMKAWTHMTSTSNGEPVLAKTDLVVHPQAYDYLNKLLGMERSQFGDTGVGKALNAVNAEAKGAILALSPFHLMQEGLRAVMTGISPFGVEKWDLASDPVLRKGVENGLTLGPDYRGISAYQVGQEGAGHSKIMSKIPVAREIQNFTQDFLFNKYIPGLKARAYRSLAKKYAEAYPEWTENKVAETAAAHTTELFGGINYKRMGRSAATQDFARLATLAPDWLESESRALMRVMGDEGKVARADLVKFTAGLWGAARVLNYLTTGQPHLESPFGVTIKDDSGQDKTYSIRTLPSDFLHAVSDPSGFLTGRASPLFRGATEMYTGRDQYGHRLEKHQIAMDVLGNNMPIFAQTIAKQLSGATSPLSNTDQALKAGGLTVFPYQSEAGKLAAQLASDRSSSGPVDPAQLRTHQAAMHLEDSLRSGQMKPQELYSLVEQGQLAPDQAKTMLKNLQTTAGLPPDMAKLYSRATRLPMSNLLEVWDAATNNEKAVLGQMLQKKAQSYFKEAAGKYTPEQRRGDATYQRLRQMFPNAAPF